jgi:hypothetical protein
LKPVIIIAIAVVCSVVAMIGVLAIFVGINDIDTEKQNEKLQEYYTDLDLAESYKIKYLDIMSNTCMGYFPETYDEMQQKIKKAQGMSNYLISHSSELNAITNTMKSLQEKYPNSDYFYLEEIQCPDQDAWDTLYERTKNYQGELTIEQTEKVTMYVSNQYEKCIEEDNTKFVCDAKLGEFTESAKLVLGYN